MTPPPLAAKTGAGGGDRLEFEILVPVWGERFIRRFAELSLRTLLAPGNLPWLAAHHRLHVTILTAAESLPYFETQAAFRRLAALADISFVQIDDLIATYVPNYSSVLTRAFNRAMAVSPDMLGRNFIFLVGDLIFADGSLETVARAMQDGNAACIMCSPRTDAESLEPVLARLGTPEQLVLSNRQLVRMLLDHMHPTTAAKIVRGDSVHLAIAHQFFWRPAADILLARCFLLHMLCIRPQRRPVDIAAPCDFSYVAELAPEGRLHFLTDSDKFACLEVQDPGHEAQFITTHKLPASEIAERLAYWSTAQHRTFVWATFVFCTGESTYPLADAAALTQPFVDSLTARLPLPRDHHHHPFWLGSVGAEMLAKPSQDAALSGGDGLPPVLHRLIVQHLNALPQDHPALAVAVEDRPGPADLLLARHAAQAARISLQRFHHVVEDVAGPERPLIIVVVGDLRDFLWLFRDRLRLRRLLRTMGPGRSALLSYAIDQDALRAGQPSRSDLRDLIALSLPSFTRCGLAVRIHDLAESPLDGRHGCIIEIIVDSTAEPALARAGDAGSSEDALVGQRGDWAIMTSKQPVVAAAAVAAAAATFVPPPAAEVPPPLPAVPAVPARGRMRGLARRLVATLRP